MLTFRNVATGLLILVVLAAITVISGCGPKSLNGENESSINGVAVVTAEGDPDYPRGPIPGVNMDVSSAEPTTELEERAAQPFFVRDAKERLSVSAKWAHAKAEDLEAYGDILDRCNQTETISGSGTSVEINLVGRLLVIHAPDHRRAQRIRIKCDNNEVPVEVIEADQSALDLLVNKGKGLTGKIQITTESDPKRLLADTDPIPVGDICLCIEK